VVPIRSALWLGSGSLPAGWEERYTPGGRPYYTDHNTRTTTWVIQDDKLSVSWARTVRVLLYSRRLFRNLVHCRLGGKCDLRLQAVCISLTTTPRRITWDDPRLPSSLDPNVPQYKRDFLRKLLYFRSQPGMRAQPGNCQIKVRRNHIFEDSYAEIMRQTPNDLKKRLMIKFEGEDGLDYGGLARFVPEQALVHDGPHTPTENSFSCSHMRYSTLLLFFFEYLAHDNNVLQINPASGVNPEHLNYFKFIGRVLGLGIFHRCFLDAYFIVSFHKKILKKKVTLADLESVDAKLHRRLTWML
jgi:E3 ubiquitin-protein ligase NEDD4